MEVEIPNRPLWSRQESRYTQGQIEELEMFIRAVDQSFVDLGEDHEDAILLLVRDGLVVNDLLIQLIPIPSFIKININVMKDIKMGSLRVITCWVA